MKNGNYITYLKLQAFSLTFLMVMAGAYILHITKSFMVPFAIAVLLAFIIVPASNYLERKKIPPAIGSMIVAATIIVVLFMLGWLMYGSFVSIKDKLPSYIEKNQKQVELISQYIQDVFNITIAKEMEQFSLKDIFNYLSPSSMLKAINASLGSFMTFLSKLVLVILFLMFIFIIRKELVSKAHYLFYGENTVDTKEQLLHSIGEQVQSYLVLKTAISLCTGLIFGLVAFVMGLDFFLVWGFIGFLFNYIPTIGPIAATIPPAIIAFLQFDSTLWAVATVVLMAAIQFASGSIIEPKIMGDRLNLNIVAILLSLFLWGLIWGVPGMILAVPCTVAINIILNNIPRYKRISVLLSK